jgi:hypothetical protein
MHVRWSEQLLKIVLGTAVVCLLVLIGLTLSDLLVRGVLG